MSLNVLALIDSVIHDIDCCLSSLSTIHIDKIFQIGFNKCGTRSMAEWFESNSIPSIHWIDVPTKGHRDLYQFKNCINTDRTIGRKMYDNYMNNKCLLHNFDEYVFYGDFGVYIQKGQDYDLIFRNTNSSKKIDIYKLLIQQYPNNSVYILNIRNVNKWLKSRYLHYKDDYFPLETLKKGVNIESNIDLVLKWRQLWYDFLCSALNYFDKNNLRNRLLMYNLDTDSSDTFIAFFKKYGIHLVIKNPEDIAGKTKPSGDRVKEWQYITKQIPELMETQTNEYQNLLNECSKRNIKLNALIFSNDSYS